VVKDVFAIKWLGKEMMKFIIDYMDRNSLRVNFSGFSMSLGGKGVKQGFTKSVYIFTVEIHSRLAVAQHSTETKQRYQRRQNCGHSVRPGPPSSTSLQKPFK
jgi:hypothetical protein